MSDQRPTAPGPGGPVPRFGMYAGPNYAGGQVWKPNELPSEQAWQVRPIGFLDDVTRTHDINYTYIEQTYKGDDAATKAARTKAYWQADKEMLVNMLGYQPDNWLEGQYRDAAVQAFVAKADLGYRPHVNVVDEWNRDLAGIDPRFPALQQTEDGRAMWAPHRLVHAGATYAVTGMEALSTSGVNQQAAMLFNTHLQPGRMDPLRGAEQSNEAYDPMAAQDFSRRILVPQRDATDDRVFTAEGHIDGKRVSVYYNAKDQLLVRTTFNAEHKESEVIYKGEPAAGPAGEEYGHANFTVTRQDYANGQPVGEPVKLPPVMADKLPELAESSHTRAISQIVMQGERATYPAGPTAADRAWLAGEGSLFPARSQPGTPPPGATPATQPDALAPGTSDTAPAATQQPHASHPGPAQPEGSDIDAIFERLSNAALAKDARGMREAVQAYRDSDDGRAWQQAGRDFYRAEKAGWQHQADAEREPLVRSHQPQEHRAPVMQM